MDFWICISYSTPLPIATVVSHILSTSVLCICATNALSISLCQYLDSARRRFGDRHRSQRERNPKQLPFGAIAIEFEFNKLQKNCQRNDLFLSFWNGRVSARILRQSSDWPRRCHNTLATVVPLYSIRCGCRFFRSPTNRKQTNKINFMCGEIKWMETLINVE